MAQQVKMFTTQVWQWKFNRWNTYQGGRGEIKLSSNVYVDVTVCAPTNIHTYT